MNMAQMYKNNLGRRLFTEIAMVEEEHVTQYESLKDPNCTWLEQWVMHEYTECYLYYSCMQDEVDEYIKKIWEDHFYMEVAHLKRASELLEKYQGIKPTKVVPNPEFPTLLSFKGNKEYIREVLKTVGITSVKETYVEAQELPDNSRFFRHLDTLNGNCKKVASHNVIEKSIQKFKKDYRYEDKSHPIKELQDRKKDNIMAGRK